MLLTVSTTFTPATDLGFILRKNPARVHEFDLSFGKATVFYPEAGPSRCTAAMLVEIDPIRLVRGRSAEHQEGFSLWQYVNDRQYAASSFFSVALSQVFGSTLGGKCPDRPELADAPIPLEATLSAVRCRGCEQALRKLFEPLGYTIVAVRHPLDEELPAWGEGPYYTLTLTRTCSVRELLVHLSVLVPVLDGEKHYWVGTDEVEKLLRRGAGWLEAHPEKELIAVRFLRHRRSLARMALERLLESAGEQADDADESEAADEAAEGELEARISLHQQRLDSVHQVLRDLGAKRVLDLGCGEGKLLRILLRDRSFEQITGIDVSTRALEHAAEKLQLDRLRPKDAARIKLLHGSVLYRDRPLEGFDAACVVEVIEHLDAPRLAAFERTLFECAAPSAVILTTPNAEYNVKFPSLPAGAFRHADHRFEWTRAEFRQWTASVAERFGYDVEVRPVGEDDPELGPPTQMGVFTR